LIAKYPGAVSYNGQVQVTTHGTHTENESNKTQRTLIYTHFGEARNSTANPIHHESGMVIIEDSLTPAGHQEVSHHNGDDPMDSKRAPPAIQTKRLRTVSNDDASPSPPPDG